MSGISNTELLDQLLGMVKSGMGTDINSQANIDYRAQQSGIAKALAETLNGLSPQNAARIYQDASGNAIATNQPLDANTVNQLPAAASSTPSFVNSPSPAANTQENLAARLLKNPVMSMLGIDAINNIVKTSGLPTNQELLESTAIKNTKTPSAPSGNSKSSSSPATTNLVPVVTQDAPATVGVALNSLVPSPSAPATQSPLGQFFKNGRTTQNAGEYNGPYVKQTIDTRQLPAPVVTKYVPAPNAAPTVADNAPSQADPMAQAEKYIAALMGQGVRPDKAKEAMLARFPYMDAKVLAAQSKQTTKNESDANYRAVLDRVGKAVDLQMKDISNTMTRDQATKQVISSLVENGLVPPDIVARLANDISNAPAMGQPNAVASVDSIKAKYGLQ